MTADLLIGIPTCNRPDKVRRCLDSIRATYADDAAILVVDSGQVGLDAREVAGYGARYAKIDHVIGPSAARALITRDGTESLILFLDDDLIARPGAIALLVDFMRRNDAALVAGGHWFQNGAYTELGQFIEFGLSPEGPAAFKRFIYPSEALQANLSAVQCDIPLASMIVRRSALDRITFDPAYKFFFEMFDFGMQCKTQGIGVFALLGAVFDHDPGGYRHPTLRDETRPGDREHFIKKWGVVPKGPLRGLPDVLGPLTGRGSTPSPHGGLEAPDPDMI